MRQISSKLTVGYKLVFPIVWFGSLAAFVVVAISGALNRQFLLIPLAMAIFGYFLMRWLLLPLVDEVYLSEDRLILRNRGDEDSFPVTNIVNVVASMMTNPERITLTLRSPCRFGHEIVFCPPYRWWHFTRHPFAEELIRLAHSLPPT